MVNRQQLTDDIMHCEFKEPLVLRNLSHDTVEN